MSMCEDIQSDLLLTVFLFEYDHSNSQWHRMMDRIIDGKVESGSAVIVLSDCDCRVDCY